MKIACRVIPLALVVAALAACPLTPPPICTEEARASLAVTVTESGGGAVDDADVTAALDGAAPQACEAVGQGDGSYACPFFEQVGQFVVSAERAGFTGDSATVTVALTADGCHVDTAAVSLTLEPAAEAACCCAFVAPGDIDIISEEPAASASECEARDQGSCIDPTGRFTPHPCCPEATGDRCE